MGASLSSSKIMSPTYVVRFRVSLSILDATQPQKEAIEQLAKGIIFDFDKVAQGRVFNDPGECIWFEEELDFVPQIGMNIFDACERFTIFEFDGNMETAIVSNISYFLKEKIFIVDLDWGLGNQLTIARGIEEFINKFKSV
jgi:hypothetical protein